MNLAPDPCEFVVELVSQLLHADVLITDLAEQVETLEAEVIRLRTILDHAGVAA